MPNRDETGPNGEGPLTGRGLGPCTRTKGFGRGIGRRFGLRNTTPIAQETVQVAQVTPTKTEEKQCLKEELKAIEDEKKRNRTKATKP